jgi:serine/threonine-protein kinase RsbW
VELHADAFRLDLPAANKYLNVLGACLDAFIERIEGVAEPRVTAYNVQLAVNEIFANIVAHAYDDAPGGRVDIVAMLASDPRRLLIDISDTGIGFDPAAVAEPDLEDVQIHGYGLFLARSLMDDVAYTRRPDGNNWRLIKYL